MPDALFGGEVSGTPIETRAGTTRLADDLLSGGRVTAGATRGALGFGPEGIGIEAAVQRLLADPADRLQGLFAALEPFERRQTNEAIAQTRGSFGRLGGRFSENILEGEARTQGELGAQFARTRQEALLTAQGQQQQALATILQGLLGARGQTLDFFAPGAPNFQQGFFGDLLAAGGDVASAFFGRERDFGFGDPGFTSPNPFGLPPGGGPGIVPGGPVDAPPGATDITRPGRA
jgi:hypothetical protein